MYDNKRVVHTQPVKKQSKYCSHTVIWFDVGVRE